MKFNFSKSLKQVVLGGAIAALSSGAYAVTADGVVGFTSTGTVDIFLGVTDEVQISGLSDINLAFTGVDETGSTTACVYRNGTGLYTVTASGNGTANAFTLTDGSNTVPYSVSFTDATDTQSLPLGVPVARTGADDVDNTCGGGSNASINVTVLAADAAGLPAATYGGTVTLLVAPN